MDEKQFVRLEAIINSMTPKERHNHEIISGLAPQAHCRRLRHHRAGSEPASAPVRADEQDVQADGQRRPCEADDARRHGRAGHGQAEVRTVKVQAMMTCFRTNSTRSPQTHGAWCRLSGLPWVSGQLRNCSASGIEERILPVGAVGAGFRSQGLERQAGALGRYAGAGSPGDQVLSRPLVPLLRDRA